MIRYVPFYIFPCGQIWKSLSPVLQTNISMYVCKGTYQLLLIYFGQIFVPPALRFGKVTEYSTSASLGQIFSHPPQPSDPRQNICPQFINNNFYIANLLQANMELFGCKIWVNIFMYGRKFENTLNL